MVILRKIVFYLFLLIYVVICPLTILYALGIIYRPGVGEGRGIVKTGLISLSSVPANASVHIAKNHFTDKTPVVIRSLVPGSYTVKIQMPGYRPWVHPIPVVAEKASVLDHILLLPVEMRKEVLIKEAFVDFKVVPETPFLIVAKGERMKDYVVYDRHDQKSRRLVPPGFSEENDKIGGLFTAKGSSFIIVTVPSNGSNKYFKISLSGKDPQVYDFTSLLPPNASRIAWDNDKNDFLFLIQKGNVDQLSLESGLLRAGFLTGIKGFGTYENSIYYIDATNRFRKIDYEGKQAETLFGDAAVAESLFGSGDDFEIKVFPKKLVIFLGGNGSLLANRLPYRFVSQGVLGVEFYKNTAKVLLWKKNKVGFINFEKARTQDSFFERGPKLVWVYEQGNSIEQAFWIYEDSHVLVRDSNKVFLIDLETYAKPQAEEILEVKPGSSIYFSEDNGKLYYLDGASGNFNSLEIVPPKELIPLPLTELREIAGKKLEMDES